MTSAYSKYGHLYNPHLVPSNLLLVNGVHSKKTPDYYNNNNTYSNGKSSITNL